MCIYIYICIHIYIYIYIYGERDRDVYLSLYIYIYIYVPLLRKALPCLDIPWCTWDVYVDVEVIIRDMSQALVFHGWCRESQSEQVVQRGSPSSKSERQAQDAGRGGEQKHPPPGHPEGRVREAPRLLRGSGVERGFCCYVAGQRLP